MLHHLATAPVDRQPSSATAVLVLTVWATLIVPVWLLPAIVAFRRRVHNAGSIVVLNVFFGWMPVVLGALPCPWLWARPGAPTPSTTPVATPLDAAVVAVASPTAAIPRRRDRGRDAPDDSVTPALSEAGIAGRRLTAGKCGFRRWQVPRCVERIDATRTDTREMVSGHACTERAQNLPVQRSTATHRTDWTD